MKQVLDLTDAQTEQIDGILRSRRDTARPAADTLAALKARLAEELFIDPPDTLRASALATEIGKTQAVVEMNRFRNFREILAVLSSDQRTAFKPVVVDVFGRKAPREEPLRMRGSKDDRREERAGPGKEDMERVPRPAAGESRGSRADEPRGVDEPPPSPPENRNGPPSIEEKLSRYVQRLRLTDDQARAVHEILTSTREKGRALKEMRDPDRNAVETAKEQIRKEEDEAIMKVLTEEQRREFQAMRARKPR
jgi:Spy/CpxP family protein refolding chaperone